MHSIKLIVVYYIMLCYIISRLRTFSRPLARLPTTQPSHLRGLGQVHISLSFSLYMYMYMYICISVYVISLSLYIYIYIYIHTCQS